MSNDGEQAFPITQFVAKGDGDVTQWVGRGMTLREYYAGQAIGDCVQIAMGNQRQGEHISSIMERAAFWAGEAAAALMRARAGLTSAQGLPVQREP